jgi:hypothetical protein
MIVLIKTTFSRDLTEDEYAEARQEMTWYVENGHTKDVVSRLGEDNSSYREWSSEEIAQEVVAKLLAKPWCQAAEIICSDQQM